MSRGIGSRKCAFVLESLESRQLLTAVTALQGINPGGPMQASTTHSPSDVQPIDIINPGGPIAVANGIKTQGVLLHPAAKAEFDGKIGTISGVTDIAPGGTNLFGRIDWGDGKTSEATFAESSDGTFEVDGSHTYHKTGKFHINITVTRTAVSQPGQPTPLYVMLLGTIHSTAQVRQNSRGGLTLAEKAGKSFTASIGTFDYSGFRALVATIDWGDDKTSAGTIIKGKDGHYTVVGTHTYKNKGDYHIHVNVTTRPIIIDPPAAAVPATLIIAQIDSTADVT